MIETFFGGGSDDCGAVYRDDYVKERYHQAGLAKPPRVFQSDSSAALAAERKSSVAVSLSHARR